MGSFFTPCDGLIPLLSCVCTHTHTHTNTHTHTHTQAGSHQQEHKRASCNYTKTSKLLLPPHVLQMLSLHYLWGMNVIKKFFLLGQVRLHHNQSAAFSSVEPPAPQGGAEVENNIIFTHYPLSSCLSACDQGCMCFYASTLNCVLCVLSPHLETAQKQAAPNSSTSAKSQSLSSSHFVINSHLFSVRVTVQSVIITPIIPMK